MFVSESMYELGSKRSAIRELFEYGKKRAAIVGAENVYDFSLGNPTVPAPDCVNETIRELTQSLDSISLHGYTSAQGDLETRQAIADYLNNTYETNFKADNLYMTMGAAASLSIAFKALTSSPDDEIIAIAPFFPEYRVFVTAAGAKFNVVAPDTKNFQINFDEFEKLVNKNTKAVIINSPNNPSGAVYSEQTIKKLADFLSKKSEEYGTHILLSQMNHIVRLFMMELKFHMLQSIITIQLCVILTVNRFLFLEKELDSFLFLIKHMKVRSFMQQFVEQEEP